MPSWIKRSATAVCSRAPNGPEPAISRQQSVAAPTRIFWLASRALPLIYLLALAVLGYAVLIDALPPLAMLGAIGLVPASVAMRWVWQDPQTFYRHKPAQPLALLAFVLLSAGITTGVLLGGI